MGLLWTIVIGLVVGVVAKLIHPGKESMGIIMTTLLGIGGSLLATFGGQAVGWYQPGQTAGFVGALLGAVALLVVFGLFRKKTT
jgi:uncharacterized membrane protein YeaQ/YmgE (transglycosylase-associated protein family)